MFICDSLSEARIVENNANNRSDMKYINIRSTTPYYSNSKYYTEFKTKEVYPKWYVKGGF